MSEASFPSFPHWRWNLRIIWIAQLVAMAGMSAFLPFLPLYVRQLGHLSAGQAQWWSGLIMAAPFFTAIVATPLWGMVADRFGRKLVVVRAAFGLGVTVFLMAFARDVETLFVLRLAQGALSGFIAATTGFVAAETPPQRVGYALGLLQSATAGGSVLGPLLGGVISDVLDMRWTFVVVGGLCAISGFTVWGFVREHQRALTSVSAPSGTVPFRQLWSTIGVLGILGGIVLGQMALVMPTPIFPMYLEQLGAPRGMLSTVTGVSVSIAGAVMAIAAPAWTRYADRVGYGRALLGCTAGAAMLSIAQALAPHFTVVMVLRALLGATAAGMLPLFYTLLSSRAPSPMRSSIMGIGSSATLLGNLLGPLAGSMVAASMGMPWVFVASGCLLGVVLVLNPRTRMVLRLLPRMLSGRG